MAGPGSDDAAVSHAMRDRRNTCDLAAALGRDVDDALVVADTGGRLHSPFMPETRMTLVHFAASALNFAVQSSGELDTAA